MNERCVTKKLNKHKSLSNEVVEMSKFNYENIWTKPLNSIIKCSVLTKSIQHNSKNKYFIANNSFLKDFFF